MALHNQLGRSGEALAAAWLEQKGYAILHRNWRHSHYEIDIIATRNTMLHFVEVKMRSTAKWGWPEESVNRKKFQRLLEAADAFLFLHPQYRHVQYDVLAIVKKHDGSVAYFLIEDIWL